MNETKPLIATLMAFAGALGANFRNEIIVGLGGDEILHDNPSGNAVELFQPAGAFR